MRANWKIVERDLRQGKWSFLYVTLSPSGLLSLSRFTWEKTGCPQAYIILFDVENQRIGLKPTAAGVKHAYPIRSRGPNLGKTINVRRMMVEQIIKLPHGIQFTDMQIDTEGILILDLRTAEASKASVGWNRRRQAAHSTRRSQPESSS